MFFDFLSDMDGYDDTMVARLNLRHRFLIEPFEDDLKGARVLDVASHDGRWSYALAGAGAREVIGVEARPELIEAYAQFPQTDFKKRVSLRCNDLYREMDVLVDAGESFDFVALFGIFYHVMDHYGLLVRAAKLKPKVIVIDGEFLTNHRPVVQMVKERTEGELNATAQVPGQVSTLVGIPSMGALEQMAEVLGYQCNWLEWDYLPPDERIGVRDYFRMREKCRRTCVLSEAD